MSTDQQPTLTVLSNGEEWRLDGKLHRVDGPAKIRDRHQGVPVYRYRNGGRDVEYHYGRLGTELWYRHGKLHRVDGPAKHNLDTGAGEWFFDDKRHRVDGPAIVRLNGTEEWYQHGKFHRADGPAIVRPKIGTEEWFLNGRRHRNDGPAVVRSRGRREFFQHGKRCLKLDLPHYQEIVTAVSEFVLSDDISRLVVDYL